MREEGSELERRANESIGRKLALTALNLYRKSLRAFVVTQHRPQAQRPARRMAIATTASPDRDKGEASRALQLAAFIPPSKINAAAAPTRQISPLPSGSIYEDLPHILLSYLYGLACGMSMIVRTPRSISRNTVGPETLIVDLIQNWPRSRRSLFASSAAKVEANDTPVK
ncbi:hypothetical protein CISG_06653 [Coccidioides immitis RMSCC 3703]|uniref:Uncharacterized protein n=1 Tax=Coccidioides immitis RMSCC 3703 TaxID=454286 RepID=A0A0J8QZC0_COCIT|nr:hypothetical protein CISG_06653 [Coccidioides immitis RMSCC 3703]